MLTRCDQCGTWFRVRSEHLEIARGMVRCGRCGSLFNALTALVTDPTGSREAERSARTNPIQTESDPSLSKDPLPASEEDGEKIDLRVDTRYLPDPPDLHSLPHDREAQNWGEALELSPDPQSCLDDSSAPAGESTTAPNQASLIEPAEPEGGHPAARSPAESGLAPRQKLRWLWTTGSCLSAFVVAVELTAIAHHQNTRIIVRTLTQTPLVSVQSGEAQVRPTKIRVLSAEVRRMLRGSNGLRIEGTLLNLSSHRLGLPKLLVRFTNLNGVIVAEGLFGPSAYLKAGKLHPVMPAHAGVAFRLRVEDPGRWAVGFNIRTCRKSPLHRIFCSTAE